MKHRREPSIQLLFTGAADTVSKVRAADNIGQLL